MVHFGRKTNTEQEKKHMIGVDTVSFDFFFELLLR